MVVVVVVVVVVVDVVVLEVVVVVVVELSSAASVCGFVIVVAVLLVVLSCVVVRCCKNAGCVMRDAGFGCMCFSQIELERRPTCTHRICTQGSNIDLKMKDTCVVGMYCI